MQLSGRACALLCTLKADLAACRHVFFLPFKQFNFTGGLFPSKQRNFNSHFIWSSRSSFIGRFLFRIFQTALMAATCVITQATKQMQRNDSGARAAAGTWRRIWQDAGGICWMTNVSQLKAPARNGKMTEDTFSRGMWARR